MMEPETAPMRWSAAACKASAAMRSIREDIQFLLWPYCEVSDCYRFSMTWLEFLELYEDQYVDQIIRLEREGYLVD
jgi:hypothetical protein